MGDMGQETKLIRKNWWENYGKWQPQPVMQYTEYASTASDLCNCNTV